MKNCGNVVVDNPNDEETRMNVKIVSQVNTCEGSSVNWRKVIIGGVAGITLGAAASYAVAQNVDVDDLIGNSDDPDTPDPQEPTQEEPVGADGEDPITMEEPQDYDDMSFGEAFAAARAELGPGEVFEWHGAEFSTYTKEEWDEVYPPQPNEPEPIEIPDGTEFNIDDVIIEPNVSVVENPVINVYNGPVTIIQAGGDVSYVEGDVDVEVEVDQSVENTEVNVIEDGKGDVVINASNVDQEQEIEIDNEVVEPDVDDPVIPDDPGHNQILGDDAIIDDDASYDNDDVNFMV